LPISLKELGQRKGLSALRFTINAVAKTSEMVCRDGPAAIKAAGIDALLVDQMEPAGGAVAEHLGIPFVTICNALPINRDPVTPPPFTPWTYREGWLARARNVVGYAVSDWLTNPLTRVVAGHRARWKLPALTSPDDSFSKLAQISQMPRELDFPRTTLPECFHYVGPLRGAPPKPIDFPWDRLDGRPLVYASLGTLQNSREPLFRCFAEACQGLDVQLVISHGGGLTPEQAAALPGDPLVVSYAPQWELLKKASLTITHAGLNTVLDSLANGVPLVTIPITYEQPAIARRVAWAGCGLPVSLGGLTPNRLKHAASAVLSQNQFRRAAEAVAGGRGVHGTATAAELMAAVVE
jgi:MGT family glycosyltransferase